VEERGQLEHAGAQRILMQAGLEELAREPVVGALPGVREETEDRGEAAQAGAERDLRLRRDDTEQAAQLAQPHEVVREERARESQHEKRAQGPDPRHVTLDPAELTLEMAFDPMHAGALRGRAARARGAAALLRFSAENPGKLGPRT